MSNDEVGHLRRRLEAEGEKTLTFFRRLAPQEWDQAVYTTGSAWRVRHVLAHFVSAERGTLRYMRQAVEGGPGVPRDFDIDAFNESEVPRLTELPDAELLAAFRQARLETAEFVGGLTSSDLDRRGYHPWFGDADLRFMLKLTYRHPMLHLRDVRQALDTGAPLPHGEGYTSFARSDSTPGAGA